MELDKNNVQGTEHPEDMNAAGNPDLEAALESEFIVLRRKWMLISFAVYVVLFIVMCKLGFRTVAPIVAIFPVGVIGWFYGLKPGIWAGLGSLLVNIMMFFILDLEIWESFILHGAWLPGTFGLVAVGGMIGWMRSMSVQLRGHRDSLEEMVNLRTADLLNSKNELENLINTSLDPIIVCNTGAFITRFNKAFLDLIGYSETEVLGKKFYNYFTGPQGTYEVTTGETVTIEESIFNDISIKLEQLSEQGKISNWKTYFQRKDQTLVPVMVNIVLLSEEQGGQTGSFVIIRDLTEFRKADQAMMSREVSEKSNQAKSAFLANMSHEIRTPMNGVIGFTDMLLDTELNSEQSDYAQTIKRSGESLLSLINDILDYSKIEAGKIVLEETDFDMEILAFDVCELIRPRLDKGVEIICRIGDELPAHVAGDPHRIKQVLVNLMGNASKFTPSGEIELSVNVEEEQDGKSMIHAQIRDTGIGIPADKVESIFKLFEQVDDSTTRRYGGTGLGLSICRQIAQLMGGNVWAESSGGAGSIFHFTAWVKLAEKKQVRRFHSVPLSGRKVLIADDNKRNLKVLKNMIESAGMRVEDFSSGEGVVEAMRKASDSQDPFDLCILDIMMPGLNGYELTGRIRTQISTSVPVLAVSSSIEKGDAKKCQEAGFSAFLPKPLNRSKLFKMIERLLSETADKEQFGEEETKLITQYSVVEDDKHAVLILLAEDNPVNQKLAVSLLTKAGYSVEIAENGKEAVEMYSAKPHMFDVILMDIQMPELSGIDATKLLREKGFMSVPIIAMTANAMKGDREKCLEAGMTDYIAKPIKREVVFEMLQKWVIDNRDQQAIVY